MGTRIPPYVSVAWVTRVSLEHDTVQGEGVVRPTSEAGAAANELTDKTCSGGLARSRGPLRKYAALPA
jgi:hypothetical protein